MKNKINKKYISIAVVGILAIGSVIGITNSKTNAEEVVAEVSIPEPSPSEERVIPPIVPNENAPKTDEEKQATTNVNFDESLNTENNIVLTNTNKDEIKEKSQTNTKPSEPSYSATNIAQTKGTPSTPTKTYTKVVGPITDPNDPNYDPMKDPTRKPDGTPITQEDLSKTDSNVEPPATSTGGGSSSNSNNSSTPKDGDVRANGDYYLAGFGWITPSTGTNAVSSGEHTELSGEQVGIMD